MKNKISTRKQERILSFPIGKSVAEIARAVGVSPTFIYRLRARHGLTKPRRVWTPETLAELVKTKLAGATAAEMCNRFNLRLPDLYVALRRGGFTPRPYVIRKPRRKPIQAPLKIAPWVKAAMEGMK